MSLISRIASFFSKRAVGLDIGTTSIKMVEIEESDGAPRLAAYGILETYDYLRRGNAALHGDGLTLLEAESAGLVRMLVKNARIESRDVIASIPASASFTALIEIPLVNQEETRKIMEYQARAIVPRPLTDVALEWLPTRSFEDDDGAKKQEIFLVAISKEEIGKYGRVCAAAGLTLRALEIEGASLARVLTRGAEGESLIIDIGGQATTICVGWRGMVLLNTSIDFAGNSLTRAIARGLNVSEERAESLKREEGLKGTGGTYELSSLMAPHVDIILGEAKRVLKTYEDRHKREVGRVVFVGGGANLKGLVERAAREFAVPVSRGESL
ncbi:MAG: pilus assembly protein PilM, partial [Candidatus Colwellbacteria bacterium]|nr:pilus assembly protein PilM [Candidatus Colwellbacteria bacterium]